MDAGFRDRLIGALRILACAGVACASVAALAQTPADKPPRHAKQQHGSTGTRDAARLPSSLPAVPARPRTPDLRLDQRYHHNHYYPPPGYRTPALPGGSLSITFGASNLFFHGGVWFRPWGGSFVVIMPPLGVVVPLLPPAYVTLWMGGEPYYYANGVYYRPYPTQGYVVVAPPPGAPEVQPPPVVAAPAMPPEPIIYPRTGQTPEQTEVDRRECNRWATTQPSALSDASVFQRAVAACMDGRGYTVR